MTVQIKLTDLQYVRLQRIRKAYAERGLNYTLTEVGRIVFRGHMKEYIDQQLDHVEGQLFSHVSGRVRGPRKSKTEKDTKED